VGRPAPYFNRRIKEMRSPLENTKTGQNRVIRKKSDLTGYGKGDWLRIDLADEQYKKNYDKIFRKEED